MVGYKLNGKVFSIVLCCLWLSYLIVGLLYASNNNQTESDGVSIIRNPYLNYDKKFLNWKSDLEDFINDPFFIEVTLFVDTLVDGYRNQVIFGSNNKKSQDFVRNTIRHSKRYRWPIIKGTEERLTIEKMAAGEITFIKKNERRSIYITILGFQERSSGYYLEFKNADLKSWIDDKVKEWAKNNSNMKSYDVESDKSLSIFEWYKRNTRFH